MSATMASRSQRRRELRAATRRRVRGGDNRAPVKVQRLAQQVDDAAYVATGRVRRALEGDRPLLLGLLGLLVVGGLIISGPLNSYLDQRDRVVLLEQQLAVLTDVSGELDQRAADLRDPEHTELLAREAFGYIRPGEVGYVVVPPEQDPSMIAESTQVEVVADMPWWRSAWERVTGLFG